jgi:hypothetical protein
MSKIIAVLIFLIWGCDKKRTCYCETTTYINGKETSKAKTVTEYESVKKSAVNDCSPYTRTQTITSGSVTTEIKEDARCHTE